MTVEVRPLGDKCNIKCRYCYQEGIRTAGNVPTRYDLDAIMATLDRLAEPFSLFGGEIMLTRRPDLERLMQLGFDRHGGVGMQTNGTLIEERDIELFRKYHVRVGISIDGPGPLNDARWAGSLAATRRATARIEAAIETLCREGMPPNVIVTLNRMNAAPARLGVLCEWIGFLGSLGVRKLRLHLLEQDETEGGEGLALTAQENLAALRRLRRLEQELPSVQFDIFAEMAAMLRGDDAQTSCVFHACDPYATRAVVGVESDGRLGNCGRTNKDGVTHLRAGREAFERQLSLYRTPQADGGCEGCRFFLACKGNCPGTAIDGDWRMRSIDCPVWFGLFEDIETELQANDEVAISRSECRSDLEAKMIAAWSIGDNPTLHSLLQQADAP
jgi:uncharacterized protein